MMRMKEHILEETLKVEGGGKKKVEGEGKNSGRERKKREREGKKE